ncbi:MAG TPA: OsmC family protein [Dongiaceae bacterium]|jgi:organic hydroperoxide reductase OsmC/OhrA|nr:OsmC family protein [Dongiaceae bacterium]
MSKSHHYDLKLRWTGAAMGPTASYAGYSREYRIEIAGKPPITGSADPTFRGDPALANPEDMLVAALSACHMLSYLAVCALGKIKVISYEDAASGTMTEIGPQRSAFTEVVLRPRVVISADSDAAKAKALHDQAHKICFIANSVNFPVRHEPEISQA